MYCFSLYHCSVDCQKSDGLLAMYVPTYVAIPVLTLLVTVLGWILRCRQHCLLPCFLCRLALARRGWLALCCVATQSSAANCDCDADSVTCCAFKLICLGLTLGWVVLRQCSVVLVRRCCITSVSLQAISPTACLHIAAASFSANPIVSYIQVDLGIVAHTFVFCLVF